MDSALETRWWALTIRGIAAVLFGIAAVFWPHLTLVTLIYIFSAWILVDGVVQIVAGISRLGKHQVGFLGVVVGLIELGLGVYLLRHPHVAFTTLILLIGFLLVIYGIVLAVSALASHDESSTQKTISVVVAVAAILAGVVTLFQPEKSGVAFVWIVGLYALVSGSLLIAMSVDLHRLEESSSKR